MFGGIVRSGDLSTVLYILIGDLGSSIGIECHSVCVDGPLCLEGSISVHGVAGARVIVCLSGLPFGEGVSFPCRGRECDDRSVIQTGLVRYSASSLGVEYDIVCLYPFSIQCDSCPVNSGQRCDEGIGERDLSFRCECPAQESVSVACDRGVIQGDRFFTQSADVLYRRHISLSAVVVECDVVQVNFPFGCQFDILCYRSIEVEWCGIQNEFGWTRHRYNLEPTQAGQSCFCGSWIAQCGHLVSIVHRN